MLRQITSNAMRAANRWLFSTIRKKPRSTRKSQKAQQLPIDDAADYDIDSFDCFKSVSKIHQAIASRVDLESIKAAKALYEKVDEQSTRLLRLEAEKLIIKISQGQLFYKQLQKLLSLTVAMQLRFRRWDDMVLNLNNFIQAIKYERGENSQQAKFTLSTYHRLCAIYVMNDHEQLYNLMDYQWKLVSERRKKTEKKDKIDPFGFGFVEYHRVVVDFASDYEVNEQNSEILLMQAMGLLVLGLKQRALKRLALLTGKRIGKQLKEEAYLTILISLSFKSKDAESLSQKQLGNIKNATQLSVYDAQELAKSYISVEDCEAAVKALLRHFHKRDVAALNNNLISKYWQILALICQNFYLEGKEDEYLRFTTLLKTKNHENLNFMLRYFQLARCFDKNDLEKAEGVFAQIKNEDQEFQNGLRPFYRLDRVILDQLRVNVLKMGCGICQFKGDKEKAEQYQDEAALLECKLGVYTIREPEQLNQDNSLTVDWRKTVSGRVPYYYLNLKLEKLFLVESNVFGQNQF